jgi:hypothetical protein
MVKEDESERTNSDIRSGGAWLRVCLLAVGVGRANGGCVGNGLRGYHYFGEEGTTCDMAVSPFLSPQTPSA